MRKKSAYVRTVFSMTPLNVAFRRSLTGGNLQAWHEMVAMVADAQLINHRDHFVWRLHQNGLFQSNPCTELS
jgi:hypothetical protein